MYASGLKNLTDSTDADKFVVEKVTAAHIPELTDEMKFSRCWI
jgi:hypothetical protein